MTREEFNEGLRSLGRGHRQLQALTPERMAAFYDAFGHHSSKAWGYAVWRLLREPRWPSPAIMGKALEESEESVRRERQESDRAAAAAAFGGDHLNPDRFQGPALSRVWASALTRCAKTGSPRLALALLDELIPALSEDDRVHADNWRAELMDFGDEWPSNCAGGVYRMPSGLRVSEAR